MPAPRFDQARPFILLGIVIAAWLFLPVAFKRLMRASFYELSAPAGLAASYARDLQEYWALRTRSEKELLETARDLASVNAQYELQLQQTEALATQVKQLEEILRLPSSPAHRTEVARVVRRDFSTWWQRIIIRKGRNFGITVGAPVIFAGGVVGKVTEVNVNTAIVDLISSPSLRLAAAAEGDTRPFSYQGGPNPPFGEPRGKADSVPLDVFASKGNPTRIFTTGLGGVFPAGLLIGKIVALEPSPDGLFKTGTVELDPRLNDLSLVAVLVPITPDETR